MIVKTLTENTSISDNFGCEHGLSLFIKTKSRNILFDVGASELFYENAKKLDVDISKVDYLIISHGHCDHGGGLETFLRKNPKAEVFVHRFAFEGHYARRDDEKLDFIGLDKGLKQNTQIIFTSDRFFISKGIELFSNIIQKMPCPQSNDDLLAELDGQLVKDQFAHEQNLMVEQDGVTLLITGCAHSGIVNILEHYKQLKGGMPNYVIGGFHLSGKQERAEEIDKIGEYLLGTGAKFYTCHCTGEDSCNRLKGIMGDKIDVLSAGVSMEL